MIVLNNLKNYSKIKNDDISVKEYYKFNDEMFSTYRKLLQERKNNYKNKFILSIDNFLNNFVDLFLKSLGFDYKNTTEVAMLRFKNNKFVLLNYKDEENSSQKYPFLLQNMLGNEMYSTIQKLNYCKREEQLHEYYYHVINLLKIHLKKNGCVFFTFFNNCVNSKTIEIYFILSTLFEKVFLINPGYIYCFNFLNNLEEFEYPCHIDFVEKQNMKQKIISYFIEYHTNMEKSFKLFIDEKYDQYIDLFVYINSDFILNLINYNEYLDLQILTVKRLLFDDKKNKVVRISSNINYKEGKTISHIIKKNGFKKCLEIGFAFGISSKFILESSIHVKLISIDPYQSSQWNNYGLKLLKKLNLISRHTLIEKKSYEGLPILLNKFGEKYFDFIFVDGFHTFDYTLLDIFFSVKLLNINGVLVIDDCLHNAVSKVVNYIDTNYNYFLKKLESNKTKTIAVYTKIKEDNRTWDFHKQF